VFTGDSPADVVMAGEALPCPPNSVFIAGTTKGAVAGCGSASADRVGSIEPAVVSQRLPHDGAPQQEAVEP
jgi:hypothetical protein